MRILFSCLALLGLTSASTLHYAPLVLSATGATTETQQLRDQLPANTEYLSTNHQGYYSYGYSGDSSAKAEYKSMDGSAIGFYSYVDANGKLQTVEYVANRQHGFQAAGTNLPKAPVDNNVAPEPVKDTPEVEEARRAHLEAYREAELKAASADDNNGDDDGDRKNNADQENAGDSGVDTETSTEMISMENNMDMEAEKRKDDKSSETQNNGENNVGKQEEEKGQEEEQPNEAARLAAISTQNEILSYNDLLNNLNLYTANNFAQPHLSSSIDLNLLYANTGGLNYLEPQTTKYATFQPTTYEDIQLPTQSYYSVLGPRTIVTPRVISTLPRLRGSIATTTYENSLPLAVETRYLSHGTYAKK